MTRQPFDEDPYWNRHVVLGEEAVYGRRQQIRMRLHRSEERFAGGDDHIPLTQRSGERTYFHAKPYILIPDITMTVAPSQPNGGKSALGTEIGRVVGSHVGTPKPLEIGEAQAWYYPQDRALMLWECFLEDRIRQHSDPSMDPLYQIVWTGFEQLLVHEVPDVEHVYTTREPIYDNALFARFLERKGYRPFETVSFIKHLPHQREVK